MADAGGAHMERILLTGAGFSRTWGGWLAAEVFEWLIGSRRISESVRTRLWKARGDRGFEGVLDDLQRGGDPEDLAGMLAAIGDMFMVMNSGFEHKSLGHGVTSFLGQFSAIFTLNQDLLLERLYESGPQGIGGGVYHPGVRLLPGQEFFGGNIFSQKVTSAPVEDFKIHRRDQPYFKLHGSSSFVDCDAVGEAPLMIIGGNKATTIQKYPLLNWYSQCFRKYLNRPETRLMVIGYSFGDDHINDAIRTAALASGLEIFIIDPLGVDVLDRNRGNLKGLYDPDPRLDLAPYVVGASRRVLTAIFGDDTVELTKISRFMAQNRD